MPGLWPSAAGDLLDAEDHELGRLDDRNTDLGHDLAGFTYVRGVRVGITLDEERLLRRLAEQRADAPLAQQKVADAACDALPEGGGADVLEVAVRVPADRPRTPDADRAVQRSDEVDAVVVQLVLISLCQRIA